MSGPLPNPNIEPSPYAKLDDAALAQKFTEIQENLDALNGRFPVGVTDLLGVFLKAIGLKGEISGGKAECTFGGASIEASQSITHNLKTTPVFAGPIFEDAGYVPGATAYTSTTFLARCQKRDGTTPGAGTKAVFHWIAVA